VSCLARHIGFGCGRLTGGFEAVNSRRLLDTALQCGVRYFDTAPYYGGGDSERLLGQVLRHADASVQVCTKVGLYPRARNGRERARSLMVAGLRAAFPDAVLQRLKRRRPMPVTASGPRTYGSFAPDAMRASFERSLEALGADQVDCLMLHEPSAADPPAAAAEMLSHFVKEGKVKRLGVGTYASLEDLPLFGAVAQFALGRGGLNDPARRSLIVHGLLRNVNLEKVSIAVGNAGIAALLPEVKKRSGDQQYLTAVLLNVVVLGTDLERVIISSGSPKRLRQFLQCAEAVYAELTGREQRELVPRMRSAAADYLGVNIPATEMVSS
jgi:Aldo/keto reductase family